MVRTFIRGETFLKIFKYKEYCYVIFVLYFYTKLNIYSNLKCRITFPLEKC